MSEDLETGFGTLPPLSESVSAFTGQMGAEAALTGSREQIAAGERAIEQLRADLGPLRGTLEQSLPALMGFILDPQQQADFVLNNPLLQGLQQQAQAPVMANMAARGKLGSGETLLALQNAMLPIGQQMAQQQSQNLFNLATLGANAAARQGTTIADIMQTQGAASAAGGIGAANALGQGSQNIAQVGGALLSFLSDERTKENIEPLGKLEDGTTVYSYNYIGDEAVQIGVLAQEVEKMYPHAVTEVDGIKYVNYGELANAVRS